MPFRAYKTVSLTSISDGASLFIERGPFAFRLSGTFNATGQLQRGRTTSDFTPVAKNEDADAASYTSPTGWLSGEEPVGAYYRWSCTAYTNGTLVGEIEQ